MARSQSPPWCAGRPSALTQRGFALAPWRWPSLTVGWDTGHVWGRKNDGRYSQYLECLQFAAFFVATGRRLRKCVVTGVIYVSWIEVTATVTIIKVWEERQSESDGKNESGTADPGATANWNEASDLNEACPSAWSSQMCRFWKHHVLKSF